MRIEERYGLAAELRERYRAASKREPAELLAAFCLATGYERKYATKVLGGKQRRLSVSRRRRPVVYRPEFRTALKVAGEAAGHICHRKGMVPIAPCRP